MSITATELYTLIGEELGVVSGSEPLDPDSADKIARRNTSVRAWLQSEGLCWWTSDAIPDEVSLPLAQIVAGQCASLFRDAGDPYSYGQSGFEALQRIASKRSAKEPVQATYY